MSNIVQRALIFITGTISNALLFIFHSRVVLEIVAIAELFPVGPATGAINLIPGAIQLAMGGLQLGVTVYLLGGLGSQRKADRRPMQ